MPPSFLAATPPPPYYAVIFTSRRTPGTDGYDQMAARMLELASAQPGFLGVESVRGADGLGITVSYWRSEADIAAWKAHPEHRVAQRAGHEGWYEHFEVRIARIERAYQGPDPARFDPEAMKAGEQATAGRSGATRPGRDPG